MSELLLMDALKQRQQIDAGEYTKEPIKTGEKVSKMLKKIGMDTMHEDTVQFQTALGNISYTDFVKELVRWNGILRNKNKGERSVDGRNVEVGSWTAPNSEIKAEILRKSFHALRFMEDREDQANFLAYMLQYLHLFNDGNGRLGRLAYTIFHPEGGLDANNLSDILDHNDKGNLGVRNTKKGLQIDPSAYVDSIQNAVRQSLFDTSIPPRGTQLLVEDTEFYHQIDDDTQKIWKEKFTQTTYNEMLKLFRDILRSDVFYAFITENKRNLSEKFISRQTPFKNNPQRDFLRVHVDKAFLKSLSEEEAKQILEIFNAQKKAFFETFIDIYLNPDTYSFLNEKGETQTFKDFIKIKNS